MKKRYFFVLLLTFTMLCGSLVSADSLSNGSKGNEVLKLQQRLAQLGYLKGSVDGIFGKVTKEAVMKFQKKKAITADGIVGIKTNKLLYELSNRGATTRIKATMKWPAGEYKDYSDFGMRLHPIYKKWKMHTGIDIGMDKGANVYASSDGVVARAGENGGYGLAITIKHGNGIETLYAHNSKLVAKEGDKVKSGQVIAKAGSTGISTGTHLHFEVKINGRAVDPAPYF